MKPLERDRAPLPRLPSHVSWCLPRRRLHWRRFIHVANLKTQVTLCGRVRPGDPVTELMPELEYCPRCLYRAGALWYL